MGMSAYVYSLALVIKVGTLGNFFKVPRGVFPRPKHVPVRPFLSQVRGLSGLERNLRSSFCRGMHRGQTPDKFENVLQCATVFLIVLKHPALDVCGFIRSPVHSPDYALQSCDVFVCTLELKKTANIFEAI